MFIRKDSTWLARLVAFFWGFNFVLLFRYSLNRLYPFWAETFSLSLFALGLVLIIFFSFWWYFHHHKRKRKKSVVFALIVAANTASFLTFILVEGESGYQYLHPLFFSVQLFLQFFLFAAKLPFFIPYRLALISGILPGIIPLELFQNPWVIFLLSAMLSIFPNRTLTEPVLHLEKSKVRMLPLRQSLDFLRFLFLGLALFGIFDINRDHFYGVTALIILGSLVQLLMLKLDRRKHHIRIGVRLLSVSFMLLGLFYLLSTRYELVNFNYICATGYVLLAIWEAFYFKKVVEGYLEREQRIIFGVIALTALLYFIDFQWVIILGAVVIILVQVRIVIYIFNRYRWAVGATFLLSISIWGIAIANRYFDSLTHSFFQAGPTHKSNDAVFPPNLITAMQPGKELVTNIYPAEVLTAISSEQNYFRAIKPFTSWPAFITSLPGYDDKESIFLLDLSRLYPYNRIEAFNELRKFFYDNENVFFFINRNPGGGLLDNRGKPVAVKEPPADEISSRLLLATGRELGRYFTAQSKYFLAFKNFTDILESTKPAADDYLYAARLSGAISNVSKQVEFLEKYCREHPGPDIKERNILLELYFGLSDFENTTRVAEQLIDDDEENTIVYLKWIYRIHLELGRRFDWYRFQAQVRQWRVEKGSKAEKDKENLLSQVETLMKENPRWDILQKETNERQEFIEFPD